MCSASTAVETMTFCHFGKKPQAGVVGQKNYGKMLCAFIFVHLFMSLSVFMWVHGYVCLLHRHDCAATLHLLSCLGCPVCATTIPSPSVDLGGGGSGGWLGEGIVVVGSVHKKSPWMGQLINQGWFGGKRSLPAPSWLVRVYLFRVTHGQSRLTSNHQEQPQLRPSINKKCVMKVRGQRTGWWGGWYRGGEGGKESGSAFFSQR